MALTQPSASRAAACSSARRPRSASSTSRTRKATAPTAPSATRTSSSTPDAAWKRATMAQVRRATVTAVRDPIFVNAVRCVGPRAGNENSTIASSQARLV